jgi:cytoskeletal protein CcmA (bactofilin family)
MATNLTTQQIIKVKVNPLDGSLVPQNKQPVVLKNTVSERPNLESLGNINPVSVGAPGSTLIFNVDTQMYDVRPLKLEDMSDVIGTPANNDTIFFDNTSNTFFYAQARHIRDMLDVDYAGRVNGAVLTYNSDTNSYLHLPALNTTELASFGSIQLGGSVTVNSISLFSNTSQLGSDPAGSPYELVTAKAVKDYVDSVVTLNSGGGGGSGGAINLNGLLDVTLGGAGGLVNRQVLAYDATINEWVNKDIHGADNNIWMTTNSNNDIVVALSNNIVIANTLTVPRAIIANAEIVNLVVSNTTIFDKTVAFGNTISVARAATFGNTASFVGTVTANGINANAITVSSIESNTVEANTLTIHGNVSVGQQVSTGNLVVNNTLTTSGNIVFGNSSSTIRFDARVVGDILPQGNNIQSLGSPDNRFKDLYLSGTTLILGGVTISTQEGTFTVDTDSVQAGDATFQANATVEGSLSVAQTALLSGNVVIGDSAGDKLTINGSLASNIVPNANTTYDLGSPTLRFANVYSNNVIATGGSFSGDVTVSGNLYVDGDFTRISVAKMEIEDPLFQLSSNNTSDAVDIGFFGNYNDGLVGRYTGLFRDASDGGKYVLFANLHSTAVPTTTVLRTSPSFTLSTLVSYLESGGLFSGRESLTLNANSSWSVTIAANTLTLSSALAVGSGGLGRSFVPTNAVMVGNGAGAVKTATATADMQVLSIVGGVPTFVSSLDAGEY